MGTRAAEWVSYGRDPGVVWPERLSGTDPTPGACIAGQHGLICLDLASALAKHGFDLALEDLERVAERRLDPMRLLVLEGTLDAARPLPKGWTPPAELALVLVTTTPSIRLVDGLRAHPRSAYVPVPVDAGAFLEAVRHVLGMPRRSSRPLFEPNHSGAAHVDGEPGVTGEQPAAGPARRDRAPRWCRAHRTDGSTGQTG